MPHLTITAEGGLPHPKSFELIEDAEVVFVVVVGPSWRINGPIIPELIHKLGYGVRALRDPMNQCDICDFLYPPRRPVFNLSSLISVIFFPKARMAQSIRPVQSVSNTELYNRWAKVSPSDNSSYSFS
jgi:hypothetical protein